MDAELDFLTGWYTVERDTVKAKCREMWRTLAAGYPTLIHGDLHPGNLRLTTRGLFFVDWGYARQTLNFFDLDYVRLLPMPGETEQPWWLITPDEATAVLPAYFAACGLAHLAPDHWGHGYATEAAKAMVAYGFTTLQLHRIWAECVADNRGSARVLTKVGMQLEGRLRENEYYKGRYWDTLIFGLLVDEWHGQQRPV